MSNLQIGRYRALKEGELAEHPCLADDYNSYCYVITQTYSYQAKNGKTIIVPERFLSDGATGFQDLGCAFVFHDWLYSTGRYADNSVCTRFEADMIMVEISHLENFKTFSKLMSWMAKLDPVGIMGRAFLASQKRGPNFLPEDIEL